MLLIGNRPIIPGDIIRPTQHYEMRFFRNFDLRESYSPAADDSAICLSNKDMLLVLVCNEHELFMICPKGSIKHKLYPEMSQMHGWEHVNTEVSDDL